MRSPLSHYVHHLWQIFSFFSLNFLRKAMMMSDVLWEKLTSSTFSATLKEQQRVSFSVFCWIKKKGRRNLMKTNMGPKGVLCTIGRNWAFSFLRDFSDVKKEVSRNGASGEREKLWEKLGNSSSERSLSLSSQNPINYYVSIVIEEKAYNFPFPIQRCMWSIKYNKVVQPTSLIDRNVLLPFPSVHVDTFQFVYYYSRIFIYTLESSFVTMYYIVMWVV